MGSKRSERSEAGQQAYLETYVQLKATYGRVMYSLFVAAPAQVVLYVTLFDAYVGRRLFPAALLIGLLPWLVYFSITFVRVPPPIMPRSFGRLLLFVMAWYLTSTLVLVSLGVARLMPASWPHTLATVIWLSALAGLIGIPSLYHSQAVLRQQLSTTEVGRRG